MSLAPIRLIGGAIVLVSYSTLLGSTPPHAAGNSGPPRAEHLLTESRDAFERGQYDAALQPTLALTKAFPNQQVYAERLAIIFQHLNRPADEAGAWERVADVSPTPVDICPALPEAYDRAGHQDKALDAYERCTAFDRGNADMRFYLARAHERLGHDDAAAANYRDAVRLEPRNTDSQLGLARLDLRAGRLDEAGRAARAVLAVDPNQADALLTAGMVAQRQNRGAEARQYLARALTIAERYVDVHIALGILEFSEGRLKESRQHFDRVVQLDPARRAEVAVWLSRTSEAAS